MHRSQLQIQSRNRKKKTLPQNGQNDVYEENVDDQEDFDEKGVDEEDFDEEDVDEEDVDGRRISNTTTATII